MQRLLIALLGVVFGLAAPGRADDAKPNILFIAVDDLRCELGCYGVKEIRSPNIDRFASSGVMFTRAYVQQAVCNPSRVSIMTGLRPDSTKVWDLVTRFRKTIPDAVTMPQHFRKHGYYALSYGKIFHNPWPDDVSWSEPHHWPENAQLWSQDARQRLADYRRRLRAAGGTRGAIQRVRAVATEVVDIPDGKHVDGAIADQAIQALDRLAEKKQPFFLATGFLRPHLPFVVPKKYWELYDREKIPLAKNPFLPHEMPHIAFGTASKGGFYELAVYMDYADAPSPFNQSLSEAQQRELKHGYYAAVSFIDAQIGRLLAELERLKLAEKTVVVLWSDHGWKLGEHNGWCKQTNYEIDTHAPLIIRDPRAKANGRQCDSLVEFVDIYPTLCELAGLPVPEVLEGTSLAALLDDPSASVKTAAFSQFLRPDQRRRYMGYAMRTDRYRYVEWVDLANGETSERELYDHQSDPLENENVAGKTEHAELVRELGKQLWHGFEKPRPER